MNAQLETNGGPPDGGNTGVRLGRVEEKLSAVEERLTSVERRLAPVETGVAVIQANYATKEDLHREMNAQTWELVTFVCALPCW